MTLAQLLQEKSALIILGAGGVGKTTTAVALAIAAAQRGRRVALLSIDPAKRLAAALGLQLGSQLLPVTLPHAAGSLHAAMLDQKAIFDEQVLRFVKKESLRQKILQNRLYQQVASSLGGPLEYIAVAKLEQLLSDARFDLVILDTPPDTHALDFLARPDILAGFSDNKVMTWLIKPFNMARKLGMHHMLSVGEKLMGGIAKVTGVAALATLAEFLVLMEEVIEGFNRSGQILKQRLQQTSTGFVLVAAPRSAPIRAGKNLLAELHRLHLRPSIILLNLALDKLVVEQVKALAPAPAWTMLQALQQRAHAERSCLEDLSNFLANDLKLDTAIKIIAEKKELVLSVEAVAAFAEELVNG